MQKIIEMQAKFETLKQQAQALLDAGKVEEAKAKMEEVKSQKAAIEMQKQLDMEEKAALEEKAKAKRPAKDAKDALKEFGKAAKNGFKNSMNETTPADGGYTVPEDVLTQINTYKTSKASLLDLVRVEKVSTNTGSRTFKKRSQQTGFAQVGEGGKIGATETPKFERQDYNIKKYAGYLPVTNELIKDSDANVGAIIVEWMGDESRVTANKLILEKIKTVAETAIAGLDDIKKALNVTLGAAFKPTSKIITNDDGLQWLDTLKDSDGNYLLAPNPAEPMVPRLCAGATTVPVKVYSNADLPTTDGKIPLIIGDLYEGITFWDRESMSIRLSDTATIGELNAYEEDLTIYRAIEREDVTTRDTEAFVYGVVSVGA